jgi:hypothetical protein
MSTSGSCEQPHCVTLQQTLIEPAKRSRGIDQVDLKDPVSNAPQFIEIAHGLRIFRRYPRQGLFARNMRMGELADQVTGDLLRERVKLGAGDVGMSVIVTPHSLEDDRKIGNEATSGMIAKHVGSADVRLPVLEHRAEVDVDNIVAIDRANRRIVGGDRQGIRAGPDDALVPVLLDAKPLQCNLVNVMLDVALASPGLQETVSLDRIEQTKRFVLGRN